MLHHICISIMMNVLNLVPMHIITTVHAQMCRVLTKPSTLYKKVNKTL